MVVGGVLLQDTFFNVEVVFYGIQFMLLMFFRTGLGLRKVYKSR